MNGIIVRVDVVDGIVEVGSSAVMRIGGLGNLFLTVMVREERDERLAALVTDIDTILDEALERYGAGVVGVDAVVLQRLH